MNVKLCKYNSKCKKLFRKAKADPTKLNVYKNYRKTLTRLKLHENRDCYSY